MSQDVHSPKLQCPWLILVFKIDQAQYKYTTHVPQRSASFKTDKMKPQETKPKGQSKTNKANKINLKRKGKTKF